MHACLCTCPYACLYTYLVTCHAAQRAVQSVVHMSIYARVWTRADTHVHTHATGHTMWPACHAEYPVRAYAHIYIHGYFHSVHISTHMSKYRVPCTTSNPVPCSMALLLCSTTMYHDQCEHAAFHAARHVGAHAGGAVTPTPLCRPPEPTVSHAQRAAWDSVYPGRDGGAYTSPCDSARTSEQTYICAPCRDAQGVGQVAATRPGGHCDMVTRDERARQEARAADVGPEMSAGRGRGPTLSSQPQHYLLTMLARQWQGMQRCGCLL